MRTLIIVEPGAVGPTPDVLIGILEAFRGWRDRWRSKMEIFEFFAGRAGGWAVFNGDENELTQMMMEFPLAAFSVVSVHPTVDGDGALERLIDTMKQMVGSMGSRAGESPTTE